MITDKRFARIEKAVREAGFGYIIDWSENIAPPESAEEFASQAVYVICNSGMRQAIAKHIHERCMLALRAGLSATTAFGHPGKAAAIDEIWAKRGPLFQSYCAADDKIVFCHSLPWIGPVTRHHLAKNFGVATAKPDVHLERLAKREGRTTQQLCARLANRTGHKIAVVDSILWRACAEGIINSRRYEREGWRAAFNGKPTYVAPEEQLQSEVEAENAKLEEVPPGSADPFSRE